MQQDQGPSGHARVYLTTKVVARHGATPGCSGCVGLGPHTEACRVRSEKALADERTNPVEAPVGPIIEPATESQESASVAQQEPASSSFGPAAPMPTQNLQNEQMDSPMELGAQERRERKGARPSETPTSEISGRPVVKARPASPPLIVPMAEGSGTVAVYLSASSLRCPQSRYTVTDCLKFSRLVQRSSCEEALTPFQHFAVNLSINKSFTKNAANYSKLTTNWQS